MSRRTKLIAVRVGASCTGSGFSSQKTIAHSAAPPFRKRTRRAFAARLQARSQRAGLLPAFFGLRLRLFFPRGPRVTAVRSFAASLCAASVP